MSVSATFSLLQNYRTKEFILDETQRFRFAFGVILNVEHDPGAGGAGKCSLAQFGGYVYRQIDPLLAVGKQPPT